MRARQRRFDYALCHPAPRAMGTLEGLQAGDRLALLCNASTTEVAAWPRSPLAERFELSAFSCECGALKHHAPIYESPMSRLQARAHQCLLVSDAAVTTLVGRQTRA